MQKTKIEGISYYHTYKNMIAVRLVTILACIGLGAFIWFFAQAGDSWKQVDSTMTHNDVHNTEIVNK